MRNTVFFNGFFMDDDIDGRKNFMSFNDICNSVLYDKEGVFCKTSGDGFHSKDKKEVRILEVHVNLCADEDDLEGFEKFGEVRFYFDTNTWNTKKNGLIYTDTGFLADADKIMSKNFEDIIGVFYIPEEIPSPNFEDMPLTPVKVMDWTLNYSEHGMQGNDYVSFDFKVKLVDKPE